MTASLAAPPPSTRVSVVIPCHNEMRTIASLLDAVAGQDMSLSEIIVVNDASTDDSVQAVRRWSEGNPCIPVKVIPSEGRGPAAAMNTGIRAASGDVIVRLDGHCRPRRNYVRLAVHTLQHAQAGIVGGVWEIEPGGPGPVARAIASTVAHPLGTGGAAYRNREMKGGTLRGVDTVPFGCYTKALWRQLGGYDESLSANEDYDFNYRARQLGCRVVLNTGMRCTYFSRPTLRALARQYFGYGFWKTRMLRKSPQALRLRQIPPALALPWVVVTLGMLSLAPGWTTLLMASLYPAAILLAGLQIAIAKRDGRLVAPALAALLIQHAAWSVGFWRGWLASPALSAAR